MIQFKELSWRQTTDNLSFIHQHKYTKTTPTTTIIIYEVSVKFAIPFASTLPLPSLLLGCKAALAFD